MPFDPNSRPAVESDPYAVAGEEIVAHQDERLADAIIECETSETAVATAPPVDSSSDSDGPVAGMYPPAQRIPVPAVASQSRSEDRLYHCVNSLFVAFVEEYWQSLEATIQTVEDAESREAKWMKIDVSQAAKKVDTSITYESCWRDLHAGPKAVEKCLANDMHLAEDRLRDFLQNLYQVQLSEQESEELAQLLSVTRKLLLEEPLGSTYRYSFNFNEAANTMARYFKLWHLSTFQRLTLIFRARDRKWFRPHTMEEEAQVCVEVFKQCSPRKSGDIYCFVTALWYQQWVARTGVELPGVDLGKFDDYTMTRSGTVPYFAKPLNNSMMYEPGELSALSPNFDRHSSKPSVVAIPRPLGELLLMWYGGGPLGFHAVTEQLQVETRKVAFQLQFHPATSFRLLAWPWSTMGEIIADGLKQLTSQERETWEEKKNPLVVLKSINDDEEYGLNETLETVNPISEYSPLIVLEQLPEGQTRYTRGFAGLENLGNTCFMNSALQCLIHTRALKELFCNDAHLPFDKSQSSVVKELASVVKKVWSGKKMAYNPRELKRAVDQKCPMFAGYAQHDSAEYLIALLDRVHEDLNQVTQKRYRERTDEDNKVPIKELGEIYAEDYIKNNRSPVYEVFHGLVKTVFECPSCPLVSKIFDPVMVLPLSVHRTEHAIYNVVVHHNDLDWNRTKYKLKLPAQCSGGELCHHLRQDLKLAAGCDLVVAGGYSHASLRRLGEGDVVHTRDVIVAWVVEKPAVPEGEKEDSVLNNCITIELSVDTAHSKSAGSQYTVQKFIVPRDITCAELHNRVEQRVHKVLVPCHSEPRTSVDPDPAESEEPLEPQEVAEGTEPKPWALYVGSTYTSTILQPSNVLLGDLRGGPHHLELHVVYDPSSWGFRPGELVEDESVSRLPDAVAKDDNPLTLRRCLEQYVESAQQGENDLWYCSHCKEHRPAYRDTKLWRLPPYFIIQLKRFEVDRWGQYSRKITSLVEFEEELDFRPYLDADAPVQETQYSLYAITNHFGSLAYGHYTAYAKNDGKWCLYDDARVKEVGSISPEESAFYLCYERIDCSEGGVPPAASVARTSNDPARTVTAGEDEEADGGQVGGVLEV